MPEEAPMPMGPGPGGMPGGPGGIPEEKKKQGFGASFFGKKAPEVPSSTLSDFTNQLSNISRRLKVIEERYLALRKKTQLTDQNMLSFNKEIKREIKASNQDVLEFKREFSDLKDKVKLIVKELKECAKTEDVKLLQNYINLWEPVNFVTKHDVERIVEDKMQEILDQKGDSQ